MEQDSPLKVSVILCTYNGALYIKEQIDSILSQSYPLFEILIFDDCSVDATNAIIDSYGTKTDLIMHTKNKQRLGYNKNFEQALSAARGDVIALSDQDDIWFSDKIKKMLAAWQPQYPAIYCDSVRFTNGSPCVKKKRPTVMFSGNNAAKLFFKNTVSGHALMVKRDFINTFLPFKMGIYYDWWIAFIAASYGGIAFLDEVLVWHRRHPANASCFSQEEESRTMKTLRAELLTTIAILLQAPGISPSSKKIGEAFYHQLRHCHTLREKWNLLFLILKHRKLFFYTKKEKLSSFISYVKHAYNWAFG